MYKLIDCSVFKGRFKDERECKKYMIEVIQPLLGCTSFSWYACDHVMYAKGIIFTSKDRPEVWGGVLEDKESMIRDGYVEVFITHKIKYKNIKGVQND